MYSNRFSTQFRKVRKYWQAALAAMCVLAAVLLVGPVGQYAQVADSIETDAHKHDGESRETKYLTLPGATERTRQTSITVTNPSKETVVALAINAYDQRGNRLGEAMAAKLEPGQTLNLPSGDLPSGTTSVKLESNRRIFSHVSFQVGDGNRLENLPAFGGGATQLFFPEILAGDASHRQITILNPNAGQVETELVALGKDGSVVARSETIRLTAMESRSASLAEFFPQDSLSKIAVVQVIANAPVVGWQMVDQPEFDLVGLPALTTTSREWTLPLYRSIDEVSLQTKVGFFNPGEQSTGITVTAFDEAGNQLFEKRLPVLSAMAGLNFDAFADLPETAALLHVSAEQAVSCYQVIGADGLAGATAALGSVEEGVALKVAVAAGGNSLVGEFFSLAREQNAEIKARHEGRTRVMAFARNNILAIPAASGFDYPIGSTGNATQANDGDGWYNYQDFTVNNHLGEDWNGEGGGNTDCGEPVYAAAQGTIHFAGNAGTGWGNVMIVRHQLPDGTQVETLYGHLQSFARTSGDVGRRQLIGWVGDGGGQAPPCHLHLEVRYSNSRSWGSAGPGYSSNTTGWTDPSNFIDARRQLSPYEGFHDRADCNLIEGWAWNRTQPNTPINVDIYDGESKIMTVAADRFRQDLLNAGKGNGYHGFSVATPANLKDGRSHTIYVKFGGNSTNLNTTGKTITCQVGAKANITSPGNGSTFTSSTVTFYWDAGVGVSEYFLYAGNSQGANDIYGGSQGLSRSRTLSNLPTDGRLLYVRLWSWINGGWQYNDYTYRAYSNTTPVKAAITSPPNGSTLTSSSVTFYWNRGVGVSEYFLYVGTCSGCNNIYGQSQGTSLSRTVSGIPASGTVYVRLWSRINGGWQFNDYVYTARR